MAQTIYGILLIGGIVIMAITQARQDRSRKHQYELMAEKCYIEGNTVLGDIYSSAAARMKTL